MNFAYLGHLPHADPLHGYLQHEILPQFGVSSHSPGLRVFQSACSRNVYLCEEKHSGAWGIGKFSPAHHNSLGQALGTGQTEFNNLAFLRSIGFAAAPSQPSPGACPSISASPCCALPEIPGSPRTIAGVLSKRPSKY